MIKKKLIVLLVLNCILNRESDAQQSIGNSCSGPNTGTPGECKLLKNCPEVIRNSYNSPLSCGLLDLEPIVCCAIKAETKRVQKCVEYSQSVSADMYESTNEAPSNSKLNTCAFNSVQLSSIGLAKSSELPHFALLGYNGVFTPSNSIDWLGGGSLISRRFVLAAGHYLNPRHYGPIRKVRLGNLDDNRFVVDILVELIIPHPDFKPPALYNDIGLLKLAEPVQFTRFIRPICLPTSDTIPENNLIEAGWKFSRNNDTDENNMHRDIVNAISNEDCSVHYLYNISRVLKQGIIDQQLCTSSKSMDRRFCRGQMLQVLHPDIHCMYIQVGVVSYGTECIPNVPSLFTRLFPYADWIENKIWGSDQDD